MTTFSIKITVEHTQVNLESSSTFWKVIYKTPKFNSKYERISADFLPKLKASSASTYKGVANKAAAMNSHFEMKEGQEAEFNQKSLQIIRFVRIHACIDGEAVWSDERKIITSVSDNKPHSMVQLQELSEAYLGKYGDITGDGFTRGPQCIYLESISMESERGNIEFEQAGYWVDEDCGYATFVVLRKDATYGSVSVKWRTVSGSAVSGSVSVSGFDFQSKYDTLKFNDGEKQRTIYVPIYDDKDFENAEKFELELYEPGGGAKLGRISRTAVTIRKSDENRDKKATIKFAARNLKDTDGWFNLSDPYFKMYKDGYLAWTSEYKAGDLNPDWKKFTINIKESDRKLRIVVWDADNNADDKIGEFTRSISDFRANQVFPLSGGGGTFKVQRFDIS